MTEPREQAEVVLRNVLLQADAVRIGRRQAVAPVAAAAPSAAPVAAAAPAVDTEALLKEALAQARVEGARAGREEGLRAGHEEGLKKGQADAQAAAATALEKAVTEATAPLRERERKLAALMASFAEQQRAAREQAEEEAVALAYEVLCRVLGAALASPEGVRAQALQVLAAARERELAFHVHPADALLLQQLDGADAAGAPRWVADPAVGAGGCLAKGAEGTLDARLETILEQCRQGLLEVRAGRGLAAAGGDA